MSDSDEQSNKNAFRKKEHRPWKTSLLEMTVQESSDDDLDFNLDLENPTDSELEPLYTEFNFIEEDPSSFISLTSGEISDSTAILRNEIQQTSLQKDSILRKLHSRNANGIMLGGFFQPQQLGSQPSTPEAKKIHSLLSDLRAKEHRLSSLTKDLEVSGFKEQVEQAELTRKAETHNRLAAEQRMREAIEQAQTITGQFRLAMDQANQASIALQEEEKLRVAAEDEAKEAKIRANNAELAMQNERMAKIAAEERMKDALEKSESTNLLQAQLLQVKEQLQKVEIAKTTEENKRLDAERNFNELNTRFSKIDTEHKNSSMKIHDLENSQKELQQQICNSQDKLLEATTQRDKLKEIISAEQQLRRAAEQKMQEAMRKLEHADKARQEAEKKCKVIEQRAKRAIDHANSTVMHLLNAPEGEEYSLKANSEKPKIKVSTSAPEKTADYSFEDEDFNF